MTPFTYLVIALGGALGTLLRFGCGLLAAPFSENLPWGTIIINIAGSFAIGLFGTLTLAQGRFPVSENARLFVMVGFCGGFTTFSSFSLQTLDLDAQRVHDPRNPERRALGPALPRLRGARARSRELAQRRRRADRPGQRGGGGLTPLCSTYPVAPPRGEAPSLARGRRRDVVEFTIGPKSSSRLPMNAKPRTRRGFFVRPVARG